MKKLLALASIVALAIPTFAFAAYNDVTLTTDAVISVGGYTLDVSGSSAAIQSITVNASNFSVTLASGSSLTVTSPTLQQLSSDVTSDVTSNMCTGSASSIALSYSGAGTVTNVITPSATVCTTSSSSSGSSSSGGNGAPVGLLGTTGTWNPAGSAVIPGATTTTVATTTTSTVSGGLTDAQIQSILSLLLSFGADDATVASVEAALQGQLVPSAVQGGGFSRDLELGSTGPDVRALQQYLNAHGFPLANSGPGSPGNETTVFGNATQYQLAKFQKANGITPAVGYCGPKTRALVNSQTQ